MHLIPDSILRAVCWTLLHSLWQGLIVALVAGIILVLTKKASSALRYRLLCGLMALFLAVCGVTFYRELQPAATQPAASQSRPIVPQPALAAKRTLPVATTTTSSTTTPSTLNQTAAHAMGAGIDSVVKYFNEHASLVVLIWFLVFLTRFVKVLSGLVYAQRVRHYRTTPASPDWQARMTQLLDRLQLTRPVTLLESALVKVPMVVGYLKPVILVPAGMLTHLTAEQVESILLHELAHIRRRDYLFNMVQHAVDTIFFFNPALIWVSSLIRTERENCCDDIAIRETRSRRRLIEALVSFHEYDRSVNGYALAFADKENAVVKRVKRIVHRQNHSLNAGERALLMVGLLILSAAFVMIPAPIIRQPELSPSSSLAPASHLTPSTRLATASHLSLSSHRVPTSQLDREPHLNRALRPDTTLPGSPKDTIDVDLLIKAKEHGVTDEYLQDMRDLGYKPLSLEKAIRLVDHGVTADFIRDLRKLGYTDLPLDQVIKLVDHGVTSDFIKEIRDAGFPSISLEKAIKLVDHGVDADFILSWKKKTGTLLDLNDYIKLRDAGIEP
jgi:bla regulator protein BlaR1